MKSPLQSRLASTVLLILFVVLSQVSLAALVKTRIIQDAEVPDAGYTSEKMAVIATVNRYNPDSIKNNREHVGGILQCKNKGFFYTHGFGESGQVPVQFSILLPSGCKLVSLWHTHGGNSVDKSYFSPNDTRTANKVAKPFYMADYKGSLRIFRPGDKRIPGNKRFRFSATNIPRGTAVGSLVQVNGAPVQIATSEKTSRSSSI